MVSRGKLNRAYNVSEGACLNKGEPAPNIPYDFDREEMKRPIQGSRLAAWIGLLLVVIGLGLIAWIISSVNELHDRLTSISPAFATTFLVVVLLALIAILLLGFRFWLSARRDGTPDVDAKVREDHIGAAQQAIDATEKQLDLLADEVARRALKSELEGVSQDFAARRYQIVVFGTGSAGKTSVINALLGRKAGETDPIVGTTRDQESHAYSLEGFEGGSLRLVDTPGLSEFGTGGAMREEKARELAAEADLLLFVVDQDLRDIEFRPLADLARIGKRSLLVLNKTDLYTTSDLQTIHQRLRERLSDVMDTDRVVLCAAAPTALIVRDSKGVHQETPPPDVTALAEELARILRAEGMDLLAQNVLLRVKRVSDKAREIVSASRIVQSRRIVSRFSWTTAGVLFVNPIPGLSVLATAAINYQMITEIARCFGVEIGAASAKRMARELAQVMIKMGIVGVATELIGKALKASVVGFVAGGAVEAVAGAYLTRLAGEAFTDYFARDQNWGEGGMQGAIERKFRLQRQSEFVVDFVKEAARRILSDSETELEQRDRQSNAAKV